MGVDARRWPVRVPDIVAADTKPARQLERGAADSRDLGCAGNICAAWHNDQYYVYD